MDNEQKALFNRYEDIKTEIRKLETEAEEIAPKIISLVPEDKELQGEKGYFYIQKRNKWKYSPALTNAEKKLKEDKKREEADGTAEATATPVLYYKSGTIPEKKEE